MGRINFSRFIICAVVIFVVTAIFENVANAFFFAAPWNAAMSDLGKPPLGIGQIVAFNVYGLVLAVATAWTYVAIRPRFGPGTKTATYAALLIWVTAYVLVYAFPAILGILPLSLLLPLSIMGLVEIVIATIIGVHFYQEP